MITTIQRLFAPIKRWTPRFVWQPLRAGLTAVATPVLFSLRSGHFKSSLLRMAVSSRGAPIPWYSYPCIDFLASRDFAGRRVLEAGAGHSTHWWAKRAASVLSMEDNREWYESLRGSVAANVRLAHVSTASEAECLDGVRAAVRGEEAFDVIVIDGLFRAAVLREVLPLLKPGGALVCDNSEGFGFFEELRAHRLRRVDFFGFAPGVVNRHCTSIAFRDDCFLLSPDIPIAAAHEIDY